MSIKNYIPLAALFLTLLLASVACQKDNYYNDGGLSRQSEAEKNMSTYDFLASRPNHPFDSLVKIIDLTNTKNLVNQDNITFFAVTNDGIIRFQSRFNPDDRQQPRLLSTIGVDTLKMLLNRFIIPDHRIMLEQTVASGISDLSNFYDDSNSDSIVLHGISGIPTPGSQVRTGADKMEYEHRKIPGVDTTSYRMGMQTHNLITKNAVIHILRDAANFAAGFKTRYIR